MTTWKRIEKQVAEYLNGERVSQLGVSSPDVLCGGWLVCETKHRRRLPAWLKKALIQAELHTAEDQTAIAVLHELHMPISDSLVLLRLDDFKRLWQ